jgi:hypothetical protein
MLLPPFIRPPLSSVPFIRRQLDQVVKKYAKTAPKLADWLEANVPESLTVLQLPPSHRVRLRTTNMLEQLNRGSGPKNDADSKWHHAGILDPSL